MVERVVQQSGKDRFCNYSFETLSIQGANYRVPVLSSTRVGKVIEKTGKTMPQEPTNRNAQPNRGQQQQRQPREEVDYTHFISVPIRDGVIRQNYDNLKQAILDKKLGV